MKRKQTTSTPINPLIWISLFTSIFAIFLIGLLCWVLFSTPHPPVVVLGGNSAPVFTPRNIPQNAGVEYETRGGITCMTDRPQTLENPYVPPLKKTDDYLPPIQTQPRPVLNDYSQMGILVRKNHTDMILPLMGRKLYSRRDKFQYYTISNTGNINTKLPVRYKGQNGMSEYGCDEIVSRDMVYVEGYKDVFEATIYENNSYIYNSLIV